VLAMIKIRNYSEHPEDWIGKTVIARTAPGRVHAIGKVISYFSGPSFTIENDVDGTQFQWMANKCELPNTLTHDDFTFIFNQLDFSRYSSRPPDANRLKEVIMRLKALEDELLEA
jgi:hypothetical protein